MGISPKNLLSSFSRKQNESTDACVYALPNQETGTSSPEYGTFDDVVDAEAQILTPVDHLRPTRRRGDWKKVAAAIGITALGAKAVTSDSTIGIPRATPSCRIPENEMIEGSSIQQFYNLHITDCSLSTSILPSEDSLFNLHSAFAIGQPTLDLENRMLESHEINMKEELFRFDWFVYDHANFRFGRVFIENTNQVTGDKTVLSIAPGYGRVVLRDESEVEIGTAQFGWFFSRTYWFVFTLILCRMEIGGTPYTMRRRWFSFWPTYDILSVDDPTAEKIMVIKGWWRGVEFLRSGRKIATLSRSTFNWIWIFQV
jgi:hypothetical protein